MRRTLSGVGSVKSTSLLLAHALVLLVCAVALTGSAAAGGSASAAAPRTDQTFLSFTASNGLKSQYHVYAAGVSTSTPPCAVFQFHGDGAYEFRHPTSPYSLGGSNGIVAKARAQGCLTIPILTPDKVGAVTWWENGTANALFARDLITSLASQYEINTSRMWLVGYSGGAQLISQYYLPVHAASIKGGAAVLFGGGGAPRATMTTSAAALRSSFRLHWFTGANDTGSGGTYNALRDARAGEASYRAAGFSTSHEYPVATGHALDGRFGSVLARQMEVQGSAAAPRQPTTSTPPAPAGWVHQVVPARTGATAKVSVPSATARTTFRVSAYPFGSQTGFFVFTTRTGSVELSLSRLSPGRLYHYQLEAGRDGDVMAKGTFSTLS